MSERLIYEDTDKRIYVTQEATEDTPQVERYEWLRETPESRLSSVEAEVQGIKHRADQAADQAADTDAKKIGKAVAGPPEGEPFPTP